MMRALLSLCAVLLVPTLSSAQQPGVPSGGAAAGARSGAAGTAPASPPRASPYVVQVQGAIRLATGRDFDGALAALREAATLEPANPLAHYIAAEVHRLKGELDLALDKFRVCGELAERAHDALMEGRCGRGEAETAERMDNRLDEARQHWTAYVRFADANRAATTPEVGRARIQAIDVYREQAEAYVAVRQRIAERERVRAQQRRP